MDPQDKLRTSISGDEDVERQGLTEQHERPPTPERGAAANVHPAFFIVYVPLPLLGPLCLVLCAIADMRTSGAGYSSPTAPSSSTNG
jgi:hypothetical protein